MTLFGSFAFLNPWLCAALVLLPALWWLLKVTPPAARRHRFPAVRLLADLTTEERTAAHTPLWLAQLRGVAALFKIALVAAVAIFWNVRVWLLTAAIIIAGVASHMPGRYRYYSVLHGRVVGDQDAG